VSPAPETSTQPAPSERREGKTKRGLTHAEAVAARLRYTGRVGRFVAVGNYDLDRLPRARSTS
jgi:hypothetical protein